MNKKRIKLSEKKKYNKAEIKKLKDVEATMNMYKKTWFKERSLDELIESTKISDPTTSKKWEKVGRGLEDVARSLKRIKKRCGVKSLDELVAKS